MFRPSEQTEKIPQDVKNRLCEQLIEYLARTIAEEVTGEKIQGQEEKPV